MLFSFLAVALLGSLGCCHHSHGVCDCEEDNYCASRAPWIQHGGAGGGVIQSSAPMSIPEVVVPPTKLPEGKKKDL
jgi:hypothetical protein